MVRCHFLNEKKELGIIPVGFNGGQPKKGVEEGPQKILEYGLASQLESLGWSVHCPPEVNTYNHVCQNLDDPNHKHIKNPRKVGKVTQQVADEAYDHAKKGRMVLTIGGDHSIGLGSVAGVARAYRETGKDICVIWVDAHADINTPMTTDSGNLHGCPVSFLIGLPDTTTLPGFEWVAEEQKTIKAASGTTGLPPILDHRNLVYIGLRDVDRPEKEIIRRMGIKAFSMHDVDKYGIGTVMQMALDHINPNRDRPIHLSFDVDALDPSVAPATGTPVRGGLTFREGHFICESVHETGLLVGIDLMEVNPSLAGGKDEYLEMTLSVGCGLVRSACGETLL